MMGSSMCICWRDANGMSCIGGMQTANSCCHTMIWSAPLLEHSVANLTHSTESLRPHKKKQEEVHTKTDG